MAGELVADPMTTLEGWTPFRAGWSGGRMAVDWCQLGARRFVEPFFYQTIASAMSEPFNMGFQQRTPIEALSRLPSGVPVAGFIFHMSRCGSTLCAQALASLPDNIVISEAPPIHTLLRAPEFGRATRDNVAEWLSGLLNAFAQPRFADEKRLIIKFSASDAFHLPLIVQTFPEVPWVFLYRDPQEILASHQSSAGPEFTPGGFASRYLRLQDNLNELDEDTYRAHCLAAVGEAALATAGARSWFLDHSQLPGALLDAIPAHFGMSLTEADRAAILEATRRHAKSPARPYTDDGAEKRAAAAHLQRMADPIVGPTITALRARQHQPHAVPV
jgi:hypothetical protein